MQTGGSDQRVLPQPGAFKDDHLVGAVMINRIEQGGVLRALIENRVPIRLPAEVLMAPGFNFSKLLRCIRSRTRTVERKTKCQWQADAKEAP